MAHFVGVNSIFVLLYTIFTLQSLLATEILTDKIHGTQPNIHHHHHHMNPNDPDLQQFFKIPDLKIGNKIPIYFPVKEPSKRPIILSREEADSIPFSSTELPKILKFFSTPKDSLEAKNMERAIKSCETEAPTGEIKFCATSLDSLFDLAHPVFEPDLDIKVTTTKIDRSQNPDYTSMLQNYTIVENIKEIPTSKAMSCHLLVYPYTVHYCHLQFNDHKLYKISLVGDNGWKVEALGMCHMDTSRWSPKHVAFLVLNTQPGKSPVCHFFTEEDLLLLPSTVMI